MSRGRAGRRAAPSAVGECVGGGGRVVLHVDMDAYFASVEQMANPRLRGKPVVVVGDLHRRSIVLTASYEARAFGIKTGDLYWEARGLCPSVIPVIGEPRKYLALSQKIMETLEQFSDQVEVVSVDEAYLDVTASLRLFKADGEGMARLVQKSIDSVLGLPASVGAAPNKILAKLAAGMRKPRGIFWIRPEDVSGLLENLPASELCGIGPRLTESLKAMGLRTCGQVAKASIERLQERFGVCGVWMRNWCSGRDDSPVRRVGESEPVKSVGHSTTLPSNTEDPTIIEAFFLMLSEKVAARLRRGGFMGRTVTATARTDDFKTVSRSLTLAEPRADGFEIYRVALGIFRERLKPQRPVRLLGVSVSQLVPADGAAFLLEHLERTRRLAGAMDEVNAKYGAGTLRRAQTLRVERFGQLEPPIPPRGVVE